LKLDFKEVDEDSFWSKSRTVITTRSSEVVLIEADREATV